MNIVYTTYAEDTIRDRNISKEDIQNVLLYPDEIIKWKKERKISHKKIKDKLLRVIFENQEKSYIVVTAHYTRLERYMKNEDKL